jgi:hypothetical protein
MAHADRMGRRRAGDTPTFKDMVAELRAQPPPEPQPTRRTATFDRLYDRAGREWVPQVPWLEPDEVVDLLHRRTPWVVEWCGGRLSWSDEEDDAVLSRDILTGLLTRQQAQRLAKKRRVPTVMIASLLRADNGTETMIMFSEGGPGDRW